MTTGAACAFVDTLHDVAVRDLGWLLAPSLLTAVPDAPLARPWLDAVGQSAVEAWLAALDAQPEPLHRALDGFRPTRLGRYAECLLEYFLTHGPSLRLVAAICRCAATANARRSRFSRRRTGRAAPALGTRGEVLPVRAGASRRIACRFRWPQPRRPVRPQAHSVTRASTAARRSRRFARLGYGAPSDAQMFIKGWLFYPHGAPLPPVSGEIAPDHPHGFWLTHAQWPAWAAEQGADVAWSVLPRLAWLAPRRAAAGSGFEPDMLAATPELPPVLTTREAPALIGIHEKGSDGTWRETARGFVVPDDWPVRLRRSRRRITDAASAGAHHQRWK